MYMTLNCLSVAVMLLLLGCEKLVPYPVPTPPVPVPKSEFKIEGRTVVLEGKLKTGTALTIDEAQKSLAIAVELMDK